MESAQKSKKSWTSLLVFVVTVAFFMTSRAHAAFENYHFYEGVRSLGMGGAYTAIVNDETALLTNPAGLGKIHDLIFTIADPEIQGSFTTTQIATVSNPNAQTPSDLRVLLNNNKGVHWHSKAQAFPSLVAPNIGFGVHGKWQTDAEVNTAGTIYRMDYVQDYAAVLGVCLRFWDGIIKIGGAGRYVNRTEIHKDLDPTVEVIDMNQTASEGTGIAGDAGLILTAPIQWFPTLSATLRDAGNTRYTGNGMFLQTQTRPTETPQTLDVGFGLFPILGNHTRMSITADYHDALNAWKEEYTLKHVHAGLEFNFSDFFFLRGGYNEGYWTAGLEISTSRFQLQAATYGEEIGTMTALREDRRFVGKIAIRF